MVKPALLKRWSFWAFPLLVGLGLVILTLSGYREWKKMDRLAQKRDKLISYNQELNKTNEEIYRKINRLKSDPVYLEEIARKEFGLVKPDEIIFSLDENPKRRP